MSVCPHSRSRPETTQRRPWGRMMRHRTHRTAHPDSSLNAPPRSDKRSPPFQFRRGKSDPNSSAWSSTASHESPNDPRAARPLRHETRSRPRRRDRFGVECAPTAYRPAPERPRLCPDLVYGRAPPRDHCRDRRSPGSVHDLRSGTGRGRFSPRRGRANSPARRRVLTGSWSEAAKVRPAQPTHRIRAVAIVSRTHLRVLAHHRLGCDHPFSAALGHHLDGRATDVGRHTIDRPANDGRDLLIVRLLDRRATLDLSR